MILRTVSLHVLSQLAHLSKHFATLLTRKHSLLRQHSDVLMMTEERVFPCQQCGKVFAKMSKLTQHMKTHSPEDHYKHPCDICGKKFTRPQHVIRHKLLHTGEKPHACPNCDKSFAREDKLKHHLLKGCIPTSSNGDLDAPFLIPPNAAGKCFHR